MGSFDVDGAPLAEEVSLPNPSQISEAVQKLSEAMKKEPLPIEHRKQIENFHEFMLRHGQPAGEE